MGLCLETLFHTKQKQSTQDIVNQIIFPAESLKSEDQNNQEDAQQILIENGKQIKVSLQDFQIMKVLGSGTFGKVFLVQKNDTKKLYAMKRINKETVEQNEILSLIEERKIMTKLKFPFIVRLSYAFQTSNKLYFVMEFMQGGEMFSHLQKAKRFKESIAKFYIAELVLALEYMHKNSIIYRDLKPENILVGRDGHIKICDFGLSKQGIGENDTTQTFVGTYDYIAPEILRKQPHNKNVDWYSLGCILYEFIDGSPPFYSKNKNKMIENRFKKELQFSSDFSSDAKDIIKALLQQDPKQRLGSKNDEEIKKHRFFKDINWEKLLKKEIDPPYKLYFENQFDLRYISSEFKNQTIDETFYKYGISQIHNSSRNTYKDFSFYHQSQGSLNNP